MSVARIAVIAAAGFGSRLGMNMPKALLNVNGRMLIERQLTELTELGFQVRVVVGYHADDVVDAINDHGFDVDIRFNNDFATTSTRDSYLIGADDVDHPCLFLDADIVINSTSIRTVASALGNEWIGYSDRRSEDAVCVMMEDDIIVDFAYHDDVALNTDNCQYEWCNVAYICPSRLQLPYNTVFEAIKAGGPMQGQFLEVIEIDTQQDLLRNIDTITKWDNEAFGVRQASFTASEKAKTV